MAEKNPLRKKAAAKSKRKSRVTGPARSPKKAKAIRPAEASAPPVENGSETFPIIAIGASAGGLGAFRRLIGALPANTRLTFVIIQHLSPNYESMLPEILAKSTHLPVVEVAEGMKIEEGKIFVMPPNALMTVEEKTLRLHPREGQQKHMPVDTFMRSLAQEQGGRSIAVILSGTGTDGALGLKEVKYAGGITFVQDEKTAQFDGMPRSAMATGAVDFVLPPEEIAAELSRMSEHFRDRFITQESHLPSLEAERIASIFGLLRRATGVDFSQYKQTTIKRRIMRRMLLLKQPSLKEYLEFLRKNPAEIHELYQDMLIKVTSFFRDPETFEALKQTIIPDILSRRSPDSTVRIWVPGCATGEEVYSLAITILECLGDMGANTPIQIFATDISEDALAKARQGIYIENVAIDVTPERLRRFFVRVNSHYQISKQIRDMCIFARQDLTRDHPFSRIDLISCRNLLIYLDLNLQKRVFPVFHYALKPAGYLMLGTSETVGSFSDLFNLVDKKNKIYSKKLTSSRLILPPGSASAYRLDRAETPKRTLETVWSGSDVQKEADRIALAAYAPPGVVINGDMEIIQFRGQTGAFLEPSPGQASLNLLKMIRSPMLMDLRRTIDTARKTGTAARTSGVPFESDGKSRKITIETVPLHVSAGKEDYFLVTFQDDSSDSGADARARAALRNVSLGAKSKRGKAVKRTEEKSLSLRKELETTKDYLQSIIEEQEATNEELKSANEEILSSNEELQSINEEMETAKEELQSTNEELTTLNEELQNRNMELNQANNDMLNLFASVNVPIVMLGNDLRIRRFTPVAEKLLKFIPADVGRPFTDIKNSIALENLDQLVQEVLDTMSVKELEVQNTAGQWYSLRIRPYRTADNKIDGAVLVFIDIDALKTSLKEIKALRTYAEGIVETVRLPLIAVDEQGIVKSANRAYLETFSGGKKEIIGHSVEDLGFGGYPIPGLADTILGARWKHPLRDYEVDVPVAGGVRTLLLNANNLPAEEGKTALLLLLMQDITDRKKAEREIQNLNVTLEGRNRDLTILNANLNTEVAERQRIEENLRNTVVDLEAFSYTVSHDLRAPLRALQGVAGALREDYLDKLDETGREYTQRIVAAAARMDTLIQDLLTYSRLGQTGRFVQVCSLDQAVEDALGQLEKEIRDKNAEIEVVRPLGKVKGIRTMLTTVFTNLISNAIKFVAPQTVPKVKIHSEERNETIRTWVEDNGIGIDPDHHKRIFRVFERLHGMETYPGTGIGLAIVRKGMENMGGRVGIESSGGTGSRFWIELPTGEEGG